MARDQIDFDFNQENFDEDGQPSRQSKEPHVYSVSDLNGAIKGTLEGEFAKIWLRGEISNFKPHTSGHFYFSLKDDTAQISAVMFRGLNQKLKFKPENGMEVLVRGKITVYEPRGNYQIFCETMEPVGAGALQKAFEQLKAKLQAEGLFDQARKRPIPTFPQHIGIVTSPTGAAIQDILNVLRRRFKGAKITLAPALVQGDPAPASIVAAIDMINRVKDIDVLIIGRGGGSIEDLWAFNDERVARAIAASRIPTISAVGHEIDFTIADFVADLRAPTPSAAAELVVQNAAEILERVQVNKRRLWQAWSMQIRSLRERQNNLVKRLVDPQRRLQDLSIRCDELITRLEASVVRYIENRRMHVRLALQRMGSPAEKISRQQKRLHVAILSLSRDMTKFVDRRVARVAQLSGRLDAMSPLRVVERGYSIVSKGEKVVTKAQDLKVGEELSVRFAEGSADVSVVRLHSDSRK